MQRSAEARRGQRRARGGLLWGLALFALGQLGLAVALERYRPSLCDPVYGHRADRLLHRLGQMPTRQTTIVMIGSSRTMFGLDGQRAEVRLRQHLSDTPVVFNFGIPAAGPVHHWLHLNRLLQDGIHPDVVLIEIMPFLLHSGTTEPYELHLLAGDNIRLCDLERLSKWHLLRWNLCRKFWQTWLMPCSTRRFALVQSVMPALLPPTPRYEDYIRDIDESGWIPPDAVIQTSLEQKPQVMEHIRQAHGPTLQNFRLCPTTVRILEDTIEQCRRENIQPALVMMPEGPMYRSFYSADSWQRIDRFLHDFSQKVRVPLIDAREWLSEEAFSDSHHITTEGSALFTDRLTEELLPLLGGQIASAAKKGQP